MCSLLTCVSCLPEQWYQLFSKCNLSVPLHINMKNIIIEKIAKVFIAFINTFSAKNGLCNAYRRPDDSTTYRSCTSLIINNGQDHKLWKIQSSNSVSRWWSSSTNWICLCQLPGSRTILVHARPPMASMPYNHLASGRSMILFPNRGRHSVVTWLHLTSLHLARCPAQLHVSLITRRPKSHTYVDIRDSIYKYYAKYRTSVNSLLREHPSLGTVGHSGQNTLLTDTSFCWFQDVT